ncbi:core component of ECF transporter [Ferrimonas lipolytica]|uniref:Core component of ECF transporter n=1 Tax=Ferrimonas lipolytica TaxID=2724191 RepID=A0A6H1UFC3_9GAMM|nr:core component of ECF transporter [Ferrimonas lipolytica]QIZ77300.1 core component of ECF transporter [Ferrimonas lipolytica]
MNKLKLADALLIGALSLLLLSFKAAVKLKLGLSGHTMFLMVLVFLLARGLVPVRGSIIYCGLLTGILAMLLGIGKGGPLILLKFLLPAVGIELACLLLPFAPWHRVTAIAAGAAGLIAWVIKGATEMALAGADIDIILMQMGWKSFGGGIFTVLAALCVPLLLQRLAHHQLIPTERQPQ